MVTATFLQGAEEPQGTGKQDGRTGDAADVFISQRCPQQPGPLPTAVDTGMQFGKNLTFQKL